MNLPKKLELEPKSNKWIWDSEDKKLALAVTSNFYDDNLFANEVCKRYNDYNLLKVYVIALGVTVLTLTLALCSQN